MRKTWRSDCERPEPQGQNEGRSLQDKAAFSFSGTVACPQAKAFVKVETVSVKEDLHKRFRQPSTTGSLLVPTFRKHEL